MALKSMIMEFGTGADILDTDYTKAAIRAVNDALRRNGVRFADVFSVPREAMRVRILIGATRPELVDREKVAAVLPYGQPEVVVEQGGLEIAREDGPDPTIMVNAALTVYLDLPDATQ